MEPRVYCRKCHYNLHGLTEPRCPECGASFDPSDPSTFLSELPDLRGRWYGRIAAMLIIAFIAALLIMLHVVPDFLGLNHH